MIGKLLLIKYLICQIKTLPFSTRYKNYNELITSLNSPHISAVVQYSFTNNEQLTEYFENITKQGGEGVMLHLASAKHSNGRSNVITKIKALFRC